MKVVHRRDVLVTGAGAATLPDASGLRAQPEDSTGRRRRRLGLRTGRRRILLTPATAGSATTLVGPFTAPAPHPEQPPFAPAGIPAARGPFPAGIAPVPVSPAVDRTVPPTTGPDRVAATIPLLPGEQTVARRIRFATANGCTVASLLLGMFAIFLTMHGDPRLAAVCLVGGVVFDGLDGALARRLGVASPFGAQLDSLADMCTFGIATPVVVYGSLRDAAPVAAVAAACAVVAASAAIRLARFNVSPRDGRFFAGVPTTMAAAVLSVATLLGLRLPGAIAVGAIVLVGLAMVSSFPYAKLSRIAKLPPWLWLLPVLGALLDYRVTFALIVLAYLASGPLLWLHRRAAI